MIMISDNNKKMDYSYAVEGYSIIHKKIGGRYEGYMPHTGIS